MAVQITGIEPKSYAEKAEIQPGETLLAINGHPIQDVLDYRFYETARRVTVKVQGKDGKVREVTVQKREYDSLGLQFASYLMDEKRSCRNKCIFCFIDQMPPGMRETLYFKDDDDRLSFLFGNYITLTNLKESDIDRIIQMHISPINISVHTTNPELRVQMMGNRFAGEVLGYLPKLAKAGIALNCQLVLCPGVNDGKELYRSLTDLEALLPALESIALVPVGITKFRQGLPMLKPYDKAGARAVIAMADQFGDRLEKQYGRRVVYAADEFYLKAELPLPPASYYGEFSQLEDGVGTLTLLQEEFADALAAAKAEGVTLQMPRNVTIATGVAAAPFLQKLLDEGSKTWDTMQGTVVPIVNDFFGHTITVAGLVTGQDLLRQLQGKDLGDVLLLPRVMLRQGETCFLDDITMQQVEETLHVPVITVPNDGYCLLDAMLGR